MKFFSLLNDNSKEDKVLNFYKKNLPIQYKLKDMKNL